MTRVRAPSQAQDASTLSLGDLLARVEAAEGPDRELDARLYVELIARLRSPYIEGMIAERAALRPDVNVWMDGARYWAVPRYTASLDAALALVERCFPGAETAIYTNWPLKRYVPQNEDGSWTFGPDAKRGAYVRFYGGKYMGPLYNATGEGDTPALAVVCALLKALLAEPDRHDARDGAAHQNPEPPK